VRYATAMERTNALIGETTATMKRSSELKVTIEATMKKSHLWKMAMAKYLKTHKHSSALRASTARVDATLALTRSMKLKVNAQIKKCCAFIVQLNAELAELEAAMIDA